MSIATERQCPRCRGWLWAGSDGYGPYRSCINCGHYFDDDGPGRNRRSFRIASHPRHPLASANVAWGLYGPDRGAVANAKEVNSAST